MSRDWTVEVMFGALVLLIVLIFGLIVWSSQDFANRCERAGGVLVDYRVCLTHDSTVLMTSH